MVTGMAVLEKTDRNGPHFESDQNRSCGGKLGLVVMLKPVIGQGAK